MLCILETRRTTKIITVKLKKKLHEDPTFQLKVYLDAFMFISIS